MRNLNRLNSKVLGLLTSVTMFFTLSSALASGIRHGGIPVKVLDSRSDEIQAEPVERVALEAIQRVIDAGLSDMITPEDWKHAASIKLSMNESSLLDLEILILQFERSEKPVPRTFYQTRERLMQAMINPWDYTGSMFRALCGRGSKGNITANDCIRCCNRSYDECKRNFARWAPRFIRGRSCASVYALCYLAACHNWLQQ